MKTLTRDEVIEALVNDDIDTTSVSDGQYYLYHILRDGFKGYANYTKKELKQEYEERLDPNNEGVKIQ